MDAMALQHRCGAQEGLILQLTEQVTLLQMAAATTWGCTLTFQPCDSHSALHGSHQRTALGMHDGLGDCSSEPHSVSTPPRSTG